MYAACMRLVVIAVGRLKQGPQRELADRYRERFDDIGRKLGFRGLEIHEIPESRARDAATRIAEEAAVISALIPEKCVLVALDERGKNIDSAAFARQLSRGRVLISPVPLSIALMSAGFAAISLSPAAAQTAPPAQQATAVSPDAIKQREQELEAARDQQRKAAELQQKLKADIDAIGQDH